MSDEQQPRAEWIFPEQKKSNKGRIWLIVGLAVLAVAIVATLLFFFLPRGGEPGADTEPVGDEDGDSYTHCHAHCHTYRDADVRTDDGPGAFTTARARSRRRDFRSPGAAATR